MTRWASRLNHCQSFAFSGRIGITVELADRNERRTGSALCFQIDSVAF